MWSDVRKEEYGCSKNDTLVTSYPEGHLNVLAAPYLHLFIVASDLVEIFFRDGEEAASKRGSPAEEIC